MKRGIILCIWQVLFITAFSIPAVYADFGLMLGSFKNRGNAQKYLDDFIKEQGATKRDAFLEDIQMPGKGIWYRVCLGPFASREDAVTSQKLFQSRGHDSVIVSVKSSAIAQPSKNSRESNSNTQGAASSATDATYPEKPPLISANASITRGIDKKPKSSDKVGATSFLSAKKAVASVGSVKTEKNPQIVENHSSSESDKKGIFVFAGDILNIEIPGQKMMSRDYDVDPDGRIFLTSVGELDIGGLDISLAQKKISMALRQLIPKEEKPSLRLVDSMRYININGGVNYPGWYHVPQKSNLDDLIEMAGGLVSGVDYSATKLRRTSKSGFRELRVKGRVSLEPNDVLVVPTPIKFERKIDSGDLLFINIPDKRSEVGLSEIERKVTQNQIEVDKSGYIYIPDYGHIYVKNLLTTEIAKIITDRLPKYLARSAKVHVNIIEKRHYVEIGGHVGRPGWYNIPESDNIQAALSLAGGAVDGAVMSRVTLTRRWGGRARKVRVNLYQFNVTGDIRLLTPVQENDKVFVPISSAFGDVKRTLSDWRPPPSKLEEDSGTKVRIFGAVYNPGTFEPKEDMNILDLLISAGGNRDDADLAKTILIRENKTQIYDLNSLILQSTQGKANIPKVQNGDSVYVAFVKKEGYEKQGPKKMIRIFGAVKKPGIYEASPDMNVIDVFSLADGQTYDADLKKVNIARANGKFELLDLQEYFDAKDPDPTKLPIIDAGDTVYVHYLQHLDIEKKEPVYLLGKVRIPGQYQLATGGMTVYQMLAYAGGLDEWADTENIRIIRVVNGRQRNISYNLRKALSGKYPELNIRLRSFDTIYVP
jgi:protein involved in polysaccharide export with SLBB domain